MAELIDGVEITVEGFDDMEVREIKQYIKLIKDDTNGNLKTLTIGNDGNGNVTLDYVVTNTKFERIRRITGYLVGTMDRWNAGKRAEESDRVKHSI